MSEKLRILVAEDEYATRQTLGYFLSQWGYEVTQCRDGEEAWDAFRREEFQMVVADWLMPKMDGLKLVRKIRDLPREEYTYIILMSVKGSREEQIEGFDNGIDDFIVKPFENNVLKARIRVGARILQLERQRRAHEQKLESQAATDELTQLLNRRTILRGLESEIAKAVASGEPLACLLFDLDNFKAINDKHGHAAGDRVLQHIAVLMRRTFRSGDRLARLGGEEFFVVLPGSELDLGRQLAQRLRETIERNPAQSSTGEYFFITASFGVTALSLRTPLTVDELLKKADHAMYRAKEQGKNTIVVEE